MKSHTPYFKENIKNLGRELNSKITYIQNGEEIELGGEQLNSITPRYEGAILKSVMKGLEIDSNVEIPVGTELNFQFGIKHEEKNIFNFDDISLINTVGAESNIIDKSIQVIVKETAYYRVKEANYKIMNIESLAGQTLTLSFKTYISSDQINKRVAVGTCKSDGSNQQFIELTNTNKIKFTVPDEITENNNYLYINFIIGNSGSIYDPYPLNEYITYYDIQLEVGEQATGYNYDYLNFGNYIVKEVEKQEDTNSYLIKCYDLMLKSMIDYENMEITYPITIRDYIYSICNYLGLDFKNKSNIFVNYDKVIPRELYLDNDNKSLGYTFRDVLDELAQVTASTICINAETNQLEVRYITDTEDTIDEEYLKDVNVNFGEKFGAVNTIVLSRSADADTIYYPATLPENPVEIKIVDNQIMNRNDRADYLPEIYNKLNGLEYYTNDFVSTGICYYDVCDRYNVQIGENTYSCVMFNDEIEITQGLVENIYTDIPEATNTDYTKADKDDRKINQTYLIVDKQNQQIDAVITNVSTQDNKISQLTQTVDELTSQISDIADITTSGESMYGLINLDNINPSEPIMIKVHPVIENISYLYPRSNLYPSAQLYSKNRKIRFRNLTTSEDFYYDIPEDLLYYDSETYDEYYLDFDSETCQVIKRCSYNADGSVNVLASEETHNYPYPLISLTDGDYAISILGYDTGYIFARLLTKNIYTTQFFTKVEANSKIDQTAQEIELEVDRKLSNYSTTSEMNSSINIKADEITSSVSETYATKTTTTQLSSRISQTAKNISLTVNNGSTTSGIIIGITKEDGTSSQAVGTIQMNGLVKFTDLSTGGATTINGSNITTGTINASTINVTNLNASNINRGTISQIPYSYNGGSTNGTVRLGDSDGPIMGYQGSSKRWSLAAFTTGGRFQTFDSNGNMAAYFNQTGAHSSSDIRFKKNIKNIEEKESINIIKNLTPIEYNYDSDDRHRGLSAQEVEKVLKQNGIENQIYEINDGLYSLNYIELIPDLINCIKYQQNEIEKIKIEMEELKNAKN